MANEIIVNYIKENQAKGYTDEQLKDALVKGGYQEKDIDEAFKLVSTNAAGQLDPTLLTKSPDQIERENTGDMGAGLYKGFKKRSPAAVLLLSIFTLGIYALYWLISTNNVLHKNTKTAKSSWMLLLVFIPIVNLYILVWFWNFFKAIGIVTGKHNHGLLFFLYLIISPVAMLLAQSDLNKIATE